MASGWEEVDHSPFLFSLFHPLLALANYNGIWIERPELLVLIVFSIPVDLYDTWIERL